MRVRQIVFRGFTHPNKILRSGLLLAAGLLPVTAMAEGTTPSQPDRLPGASRRSHIQPVGEMRRPAPDAGKAVLGLQLSRAPEILRRQLALSQGEGLVVDAVAAGSTAATIGIEPHDVLVRLDDQLLVLPEQLAVLLETRSLSPVQASLNMGAEGSVITVLRAGRSLMLPHREPAIASLPATPAAPPQRPLRQPASAVRLAAVSEAIAPADGNEAVLLREDDDFTIRVSQADQTRLLVLTPAGRKVFDGQIDTPERLASIPPVLRPRVDAMLRVLGPPAATSPSELPGVSPIDISRSPGRARPAGEPADPPRLRRQ